MGRDRDPFDRTFATLRTRLLAAGPQQGAPLPINLLAGEFGVSQTPVREVLARLAGEGLIVRVDTGYVAATYDVEGVSHAYELALGLVLLGYGRRPAPPPAAPCETVAQLLVHVARHGGNRAVTEAYERVLAQLAPLARAEDVVCGQAADRERLARGLQAGGGAFSRAVRRHYGRRIHRSGEILARALMDRARI